MKKKRPRFGRRVLKFRFTIHSRQMVPWEIFQSCCLPGNNISKPGDSERQSKWNVSKMRSSLCVSDTKELAPSHENPNGQNTRSEAKMTLLASLLKSSGSLRKFWDKVKTAVKKKLSRSRAGSHSELKR